MVKSPKVLVTGSTGFIGQRLCAVLRKNQCLVREAVRCSPSSRQDVIAVGEINGKTDWRYAVEGVKYIVHLAGRAHVMHGNRADSLSSYRSVNVAGTIRLAQQAAAAGVQRFVFVSSIKVNGEATSSRSFRETDIPLPLDDYGISKYEAEIELQRIGDATGMEVVVVRPALVYGPGVKGNFLSLLNWLWRGLPLPLAHCENHRSFVGLTNLIELLYQCMLHPAAAGEIFLASDGEDLTTAELIRRIGRSFDKPVRLLPFPPFCLRVALTTIGRRTVYDRLCGSLQVDSSKARLMLGWTPPLSVDKELENTARWFKDSRP